MKFKVGDEVVATGSIFDQAGRPRIRVIEKVYPANQNGVICYGGQFWKAEEDSLTLASEYSWPEESQMRFMDKKAKDSFDKEFKNIFNQINKEKK